MTADIKLLISKRPELEIVDYFNAIERHLHAEIQVKDSVSSPVILISSGNLSRLYAFVLLNLSQLRNNTLYTRKHISFGSVVYN